VRRGYSRENQVATTLTTTTPNSPANPTANASVCPWYGADSTCPSTITVHRFGRSFMRTMAVWMTMNPMKAHIPRKCRLRARWRPPNNLVYQGKRARIDGDMAAPVSTWNGARRNTTKK
jgi:hypothetical protein